MPAPDQDIMLSPVKSSVGVSLEPAFSAVHSLLLLAKAKHIAELGGWVQDTVLAMSALERQRHRLVMIGFYFAVQPERSWPSFQEYLDHLVSLSPTRLRDKLLHAYLHLPCLPETEEPAADPAPEEILESADTFLAFLRQRFSEKHVDPELETHAYAYLVDPPSMHKMITSHLQHMWDAHLAAEWERVEPILADAVLAFEQTDLERMDKLEALRYVSGQTVDEGHWRSALEKSDRVAFIPSAHVGSFLGKVFFDGTVGVFFGARLPEGVPFDAPDLSRAEILTRLGTLADDTRLRILRLVAEEGEKRSQEIMQRLDLSQSATSRHLNQLSATGYLQARRCAGANCYQINGLRIEDTLRSLSLYLSPAG
ncbi:MAG: winged helix-turn-helix transcriptional regulator [Chloroflexota bacterium]|nr:MAG: winged helix-turn-helix transcriptional regulator [Chloroflexota bacterium]